MSAIQVYRGDSWPITITVKDTAGAVVNITGFQFKLTVDKKENPTVSPSTTKVFDVAGVITNGAAGQVTFIPTGVNQATAGNFYYDVQMTNTLGNVKTIVKGTYTIIQDITK